MSGKAYSHFKRYKKQLSLVIFDIDHFKAVNDNHGHQAGDEVIKQCAATLLKCARATDICGRYGGEEFVAILTDSDTNKALIFAERLRKQIADLLVIYQGTEIKFTVSLGICQLSEKIKNADSWLEQADKALYHSKENGRNQSSIAKT
ncbi:MAG: GGDEF domain-containing protein [Enterobacterales bacterium]|nr:GGDEF domain-containing protein [Enterobacterales bacterium]